MRSDGRDKGRSGESLRKDDGKHGDKHLKVERLTKDREELLAFYSVSCGALGAHPTSNPVESAFSTIRLRRRRPGCGSRATTLAMVFKLAQSAEKRWIKLRGYELLGEVITE
ncbi:hypothetical protein MASR2M17_16530 [Aminivibrio sp.]